MRFKTTEQILKRLDEHFDDNWMDSNTVILPPNEKWDYSKELQIEQVDLWEVVYEAGGGNGVYAAWLPYAEFYLVRVNYTIETFYGKGAQKRLKAYLTKVGIPYAQNQVWVEPEDMYLYE